MRALPSPIRVLLVLALLVPVGLVGASLRADDALTPQGEAPPARSVETATRTPDRVLVKFRSGTVPRTTIQGTPTTGHASLDAILSAFGLQAADRLFRVAPVIDPPELAQIYILDFQTGTNLDTLITVLEVNPNVEWAEPDYLALAAATSPNDPRYADQWGLTQIKAPNAWDVTTGSAAVPIAIVDSGVEFSHPDLSGKLWVNPGEIAGNGLDDDNNGHIDDVHGWDFVNGDNSPSDDYGHGTQVAGIAAAATNNSTGIAGVCWACRIMPVKVMQSSGVANYSDVAAGVLYAAQKGARVINLSLGGYSKSSALQAAVEAAASSYGAVIVAGAGNDSVSDPFYPAAYDPVLAVAGTDQTDTKRALSNFGAWVDVSAPAVGIKTTFMGGDYGDVDGTSYASPFVASAAGLLRSQYSGWSAGTVRAQIVQTADDIDGLNPGFGGQLGSGRVNADRAVRTTAQPLLAYEGYNVDGVPIGHPDPGSTVDLNVTLGNDWADANNVQGTLTSSSPYATILDGSAAFGDVPAYGSGTSTPFRIRVSATVPYGHDMDLNLNVTASGGYSANIPLTVQTASSTVYPPATIATQTWTNDRIYVINKETGIPAGETLTIQPGTVIHVQGEYALTVGGTLIADGTEEQPILFTFDKAEPADDERMYVKFLNSSVDAAFDGGGNYVGGSILRHAIVEYGHGIRLENAAPFISHNTITEPSDAGIGGTGSLGLVVADNTIIGGTNGIDIAWAGTITGNTVQGTSELGLSTQGPLEVTANRVVACREGIFVDGGTVSGNLLVGNESNGLRINGGSPAVTSNTILSNAQSGIYIEGGTPDIHNNNLMAGSGDYALRNTTSVAVSAKNNWWGSSSGVVIQAAIYDSLDEFGLGFVDYGGYLAGPEASAPAYVSGVSISPDTTLGIQTATFEVEFSRPMDQDATPDLSFQSAEHDTWTAYDASNSGLPEDFVHTIAPDPDGSIWFGTEGGGAANLDGTDWTVYDISNSGIPDNQVRTIATGLDGSAWFGTMKGAAVPWDKPVYPIENSSHWIDNHTYYATYDITSLNPRGDYLIHVAGATGADGIQIAPTAGYTFTIDYASAIGDTSPPRTPNVTACAANTMSTLSGHWSASDPDSKITLYRYAIGTSPGGGEVVNWTNTTATSFNRTGMSLNGGQAYYVAVKARNEGGLWSSAGVPGALYAGSGECSTNISVVYLPLIKR